MENPEAFVIMQVGEEGSPARKRADEIYDGIIKPALEGKSIRAYRADQDLTPGAITPVMLRQLLAAEIIVADLTGRNPNVFYELGITHSFGKKVISIADSPSELPFDTKDQRIISLGGYHEDVGIGLAAGIAAKKKLEETLEAVLKESYKPSSPVQEAAGTASLDKLAPENPLASELAHLREQVDIIASGLNAMRSNAPPLPEWANADMQMMRRLVQDLSREPFRTHNSKEYITLDTSPDHDRWVRRTLGSEEDQQTRPPSRSPKNADEGAYPRATTSTSYDDPPF